MYAELGVFLNYQFVRIKPVYKIIPGNIFRIRNLLDCLE